MRHLKRRLKVVALDCEMVGVGPTRRSCAARVALVNEKSEVLMSTYCRPHESVVDFRYQITGITPKLLEGAPSVAEVRNKIKRLIRNKIVVGHSVLADLRSLGLSHPKKLTIDTALINMYQLYDAQQGVFSSRKLKDLALTELGIIIQKASEPHDPVIDAIVSLKLFLRYEKTLESNLNSGRMIHTVCYFNPKSQVKKSRAIKPVVEGPKNECIIEHLENHSGKIVA